MLYGQVSLRCKLLGRPSPFSTLISGATDFRQAFTKRPPRHPRNRFKKHPPWATSTEGAATPTSTRRRRGMSASALRRGTAPLPHRVHRSDQTSGRANLQSRGWHYPPPLRCSAATTARTTAATTAATTSACPRSSAPEIGSSCSFRPLAPVSQLTTWPPTTLSGIRPRARCEMLQSG
eukprot:scaffold36096_cov48-Phaeocystis_antarctica.AAC.1